MAYTQADLDAIEEALRGGVQTVSYEGKSVTYRSLDDLLRIWKVIRQELGLLLKARTFIAAHNPGFVRGGDE